jgi:hypothetical protein
MRMERLRERIEPTTFVELVARFDAIMAEENASRRPS